MKRGVTRWVVKLLCCMSVPLLAVCAAAQVPSQMPKVRITVWAERDAYPGSEAARDTKASEWDYPRDEIHKVAAFMMGGMVNGWTFDYTPSDKARGVSEYFDMEDVRPLGEDVHNIDYTQVWVEGGKVWCWIEFDRTERMQRDYEMWEKIDHGTASGTGYAGVELGFDGIVEATKAALKGAVRAKYRALVKNKPRSITGRVLMRKPPKVGISSGRYKIALDFFIETDTIEVYNVF